MPQDRKGKGWGMQLEELIYKRFADSKKFAGLLASFDGRPAVFSTDPPDEKQEGWGGGRRYPAIVYHFDLQANEERNSAGTLSVSLLCLNTEDAVPEELEPMVRECLRDVILKPEDGDPYCFAWARTDAFTVEAGNAMVVGSEMRFDILEYPSQETSDPDPIMAANRHLKGLYPECLVMGYDIMDEVTKATAERPVIYCRLVSMEKSPQETYTVAWMDGRIAVHVLCPDNAVRRKLAADIAGNISMAGEIIMLDHSPMSVKRLQVNYKSDYLKDGQVYLTVRYGLLKGLPFKGTG